MPRRARTTPEPVAQLAIPKIMLNDTEYIEAILEDVRLMLSRRVYHGPEGTVPLIGPEERGEHLGEGRWRVTGADGMVYSVRVLLEHIKSAASTSPVYEFVQDEPTARKIMVANDYSKNVYVYALSRDLQLFTAAAVRLGIPDHRYQPTFQHLSPQEKEQVYAQWHLDNYSVKGYLRDDPIVQYYGLQPGDLMRIVRPSPTSGQAVDYRLVGYKTAV